MTRPSEDSTDSTAGAVGEMADPPATTAFESATPESTVPATLPKGPGGRAGSAGGTRPANRARRKRRRGSRGAGPFVVVAAANTIWAATCAYLPVLVVFLAVSALGTPRVTVGDAARYAGAAWVLAHGVPLSVGGYPLGLVPLAVSAFAAWRLGVAGHRVSRASRVPALAVIVTVSIGYALLGTLAAVLVTGGQLGVPVARTGLSCAAFALVCTATGTSAGRRLIRAKIKHVPKPVRDGVRGGLVASALVVAAGAAAAGIAIAVSGGGAAQILHGYQTGVAGQAGIVLVCLAYAPNVAVWAAAYVAGPGFTLADVPARLPVFAGLPTHPVTGAAQAVLLIPVAVGAVAGVLAVRRRSSEPGSSEPGSSEPGSSGVGSAAGWRSRSRAASGAKGSSSGDSGSGGAGSGSGGAGSGEGLSRSETGRSVLGWSAAVAGPVGGVVSVLVLAAVGRAASGPLGSQLLAHTGEVGWQFPLVAGAGIAVGTLMGVAAYALFARR